MTKDVKIKLLGEDLSVHLGPNAKRIMAENPKVAEDVRETIARIKGALHGINPRDTEAVLNALTSIGMSRVTDVEKLVEIDMSMDDETRDFLEGEGDASS